VARGEKFICTINKLICVSREGETAQCSAVQCIGSERWCVRHIDLEACLHHH
jgi:hypothetical protein